MLLNTVLKQISNLLIIALLLALHWQFHAGFAERTSSCERLEDPHTFMNVCLVCLMGTRASQIWKSAPTSVKGLYPAVCDNARFIDLLFLMSENSVYQDFSWRWQRQTCPWGEGRSALPCAVE